MDFLPSSFQTHNQIRQAELNIESLQYCAEEAKSIQTIVMGESDQLFGDSLNALYIRMVLN